MVKSSTLGKLTKVSYMSAGVIIGSMVGGATFATAGWWYSDRLDLEFGKTLDVNQVAGSVSSTDCPEGATGTNVFTGADGKTYTQNLECVKSDEDIVRMKLMRTSSGTQLVYQIKSSGRPANEKDKNLNKSEGLDIPRVTKDKVTVPGSGAKWSWNSWGRPANEKDKNLNKSEGLDIPRLFKEKILVHPGAPRWIIKETLKEEDPKPRWVNPKKPTGKDAVEE